MLSNKYVLHNDSNTVAECFSAHYANIFLIHLFNEARRYAGVSPNIPNITEGYKTAITAYNNSMSRPDFVSVTVTGIYNQFQKIDRTMKRGDCIVKILSSFLPPEGCRSVLKQEKLIERALSKNIFDVTKKIIYHVPVHHFTDIIDHNEDQKTAIKIQDSFKVIIIECMERSNIDYMNKLKAQYHNPETDYNMFEKVKMELAKVNGEKAELEAKITSYQKQIQELQARNSDLLEKIGNQNGRIKELEQGQSQQKLVQTGPIQPQYTMHQPSRSPAPISTPVYQPPAPPIPTPVYQPPPQPSAPPVPTPVYQPPALTPKRDLSHLINSDSDESDSETVLEKPEVTKSAKQNLIDQMNDESGEIEIDLNMFGK